MSSSLHDRPSNPPPKSGLTVSKVVAASGAAATTAVVGSAFGADGTVVGAAVGSVVSAVAAAAYERSLDRTRQLVVARVRRPGDPSTELTQVMSTEALSTEVTQIIPVQRAAGHARVEPSVAPVPPPRRTRLPMLAGATAVIFLVGLLVVTGIELVTGGPVLSSQKDSGTSVGRVFGYSPGPTVTPTESAPTSVSSATDTASASPTSSARSDGAANPLRSPSDDGSAAPSTTRAPRDRANATPTAPALSEPGANN